MAQRTFTEQLRRFIEDSGQSRYEICQATGLAQGNLSRVMRHGTGLNTSSIDLLCKYLGLRLVAIRETEKQVANKRSKQGK